MEVWRGKEVDLDTSELEVYTLGSPSFACPAALFGNDLESRRFMKVWKLTPSDLRGCLALTNGSSATTSKSLRAADVPIACLMDALVAQGWVSRSSLVRHSSDSLELFYDNRRLDSKRAYLQALLARSAIFAKGTSEFRSGRSNAFYKWLMRSPGPVAGVTDKAAKQLLDESDSKVSIDLPMLDILPDPAASGARRPVEDPLVDGGEAGEDAVAVDAVVEGADVLVAAPPSSRASSSPRKSSSRSSSPSSSSARDVAVDGGDEDLREDIPVTVEGVVLSRERQGVTGFGYRARCPHHARCRAFRSAHIDVATFGVKAPILFLGSWINAGAVMSEEEHKDWRPNRAEVRVYAELCTV